MKILIVTPTLGVSPWLDTAAGSVRQYAPAARHIFVAPAGVVDDLTRRFERATVLAEPGGGMYSAINHAVRAVPDWDWMTYLNDDDVLAPGFGRVLEAAANDPADVIYGRVSYIDSRGRFLGAFPVEKSPGRLISLMAAGIPPFTQQGTLVRRACFEQLGGFDPGYPLAADFDFWVRAVRAGCSFRCVPVEVGSFRLRKGQLSADQDRVQSEMGRIVDTHLPLQGRLARGCVRTCFRLRHMPEIITRRLRTGHWRTAGSIGREEP